ncbi:hypothetical protein VPH35_097663 [Triticum aestivum]|uniref:Uncharacterized protein n=1 Tax=Aegilops tauschii TaxID=37682 RepID=N1QZZ9_AEGTA
MFTQVRALSMERPPSLPGSSSTPPSAHPDTRRCRWPPTGQQQRKRGASKTPESLQSQETQEEPYAYKDEATDGTKKRLATEVSRLAQYAGRATLTHPRRAERGPPRAPRQARQAWHLLYMS